MCEASFIKTLKMPGSKSYTNRALVMAALTKGSVLLLNPLYSEDTHAMIDCLRAMGVGIEARVDQIVVSGDLFSVEDRLHELHVRDSGTTLRFLLAAICLAKGSKIIGGNRRLNERPIGDLVEALRSIGGCIDFLGSNDTAPLKITSQSLQANGCIVVNATISSQFLSALLIISPFLNGVEICLDGHLISSPYVDMTIDMMKQWGVYVEKRERRESVFESQLAYFVAPGQHYRMNVYAIEGDFSSAGYFFAAAALTQAALRLQNLNPNSLQADRAFLRILEKMGNVVVFGSDEVAIMGRGICASYLNMEHCPDQVQTMAVLAAFAPGKTVISGVRSLRLKETERVQALKNELAKMGISTEDTHDTLTIYGGNPRAATIETYGDHRMAMAFAVAKKKIVDMDICYPEVVAKTFPSFWDLFNSL